MPHSPATGAPSRVPFWDNARFACITLVVVGHGIQRVTYDSDVALALYLFIYSFHMPAFAVISGFFSRSDSPGARGMKRVITDILLPYLIFETLWTTLRLVVEGGTAINPSQPSWTLWFLLALGIFRLVLPYLALLRFPLLLSIAASVGAGYLDNIDSTFSLSRTIGMLPFFVLGWRLHGWGASKWWLDLGAAGVWLVRAATAAVAIAWGATLLGLIDLWRGIDLQLWLFFERSYEALGNPAWFAGGARLALIALAAALTAGFLAWTPRRRTWFTAFGQATMYVYLLHSFVLYPLRESGVLRDEEHRQFLLLAMIAFSVLISVALSTSPVRRVLHHLVEPKPGWLFADGRAVVPRDRDRDPSGSRRAQARRADADAG